ncbi:DJ-1/PfpI family protein [Kitasatospora xanthocidica]|uniref:DJ-1/PfpI family protein n=1 Tax=Kitasatospora xanthocidica TaxID=83382 RepID=UPI001674ED93|nr:DJ-1/PfpI family protein [Kitasatospora xanthocidica]
MGAHTVLVVLYEGVQSLDVTGPVEVFTGAGNASGRPGAYRVVTASPGGRPVRCTSGLRLLPDTGLDAVGPVDTLLVPGGPGTRARLSDGPVLEWLRAVDATTAWTTSVCSGSLVLAAAGLLAGRRATSHWACLEELGKLGAEPTGTERVVVDGKYATAAGVSAGIDLALSLAGRLAGDPVAQSIQLLIEYDPRPPYSAGSTASAPAELVARMRANGLAIG